MICCCMVSELRELKRNTTVFRGATLASYVLWWAELGEGVMVRWWKEFESLLWLFFSSRTA